MKRRHFLTLSGLVSGACLIPPGIVRRIRAAALQPGGPLILAPENALTELFAEDTGYGFHLYLENACRRLGEGSTGSTPPHPILNHFGSPCHRSFFTSPTAAR